MSKHQCLIIKFLGSENIMKSALSNIMISLILAVGGVISLFFNLGGGQDWIWDWVGLLLAYLSLGILIGLYNKTKFEAYYKNNHVPINFWHDNRM